MVSLGKRLGIMLAVVALTVIPWVRAAFAQSAVELVPQRELLARRGPVSADGRWAATGLAPGFALWDLERGLLVRELDKVRYSGDPVAFCGSSTLLTGTWLNQKKYSLLRLELASGAERVVLESNRSPASGSCSPDGKKVALVFDTQPPTATVYDLATGARLFDVTSKNPVGAAFRSNERLLVSGDRFEELDAASGALVRVLDSPSMTLGEPITVSADGVRAMVHFGGTEGLGTAVWNLQSGKLEHRVSRPNPGFTPLAPSAAFSRDGRQAAVFVGPTKLAILDLTSGALTETDVRAPAAVAFVQSGALAILDGRIRYRETNGDLRAPTTFAPNAAVRAVAFSPRGDLAFALAGSRIVAFRLPSLEQAWTRTLVSTVKGFGSDKQIASPARELVLSSDGEYLVTHAGDAVEVLRAKDGSTKRRIENVGTGPYHEAFVFRDAELWLFAALGAYIQPRGWSLEDGAELPRKTHPSAPAIFARGAGNAVSLFRGADLVKDVTVPASFGSFHEGLAYAKSADVLLDVGSKIVRWSPSSAAAVATYQPPVAEKYLFSFALAISADDTMIAFGSYRTITLLDGTSLKKLADIGAGRSAPSALTFDPSGRFLLEGRQDGTVELHSLEKKTSVTWLGDGTDWIAFQGDGTFHASAEGGRLVAATRGFDAYRVDQLALKLNRPDKIYESLGIETAERIARLRKRHERRLAQLGIREADVDRALISGPTAQLTNFVQSDGWVDVEATFADAEGLKSYQVFVNDVPLYAPARSLSGTRQSVKERVQLDDGPNVIEISATGASGTESLRAYRAVTWSGKAPRALYFVGIGVSAYANADLVLEYAHKDALDLGDVLRRVGAPFDAVHVRTLLDREVTVAALKDVRSWLGGAKPHDTVIVLITGHGAYDATGVYYYLLPDADVARLSETAASFELLEGMVTGIPARKKLLLLDTCESGELDEAGAGPASTIPGARSRSARGTTRVKLTTSAAGPVRVTEERSFLTNDLRRRTGAVVVSASRGDEASWERGDLENGVFTQALLEALTSSEADGDADGALTTNELLRWVSARVAGFTNDGQHPTIDRDNRYAGISLPLVPSAREIADRKMPRTVVATPPPSVTPSGCGCAVPPSSPGRGAIAAIGILAAAAMARRARPRESRGSPRLQPPAHRARTLMSRLAPAGGAGGTMNETAALSASEGAAASGTSSAWFATTSKPPARSATNCS